MDIEDEESEIAGSFDLNDLVEIFEQLGPLAVLLYIRLSDLKIFSGMSASSLEFIKPVLDYYELNFKRMHKEHESAEKIKELIAILPELK